MDSNTKTIYLSFDDGPHPIVTNFVLVELAKYNAKATFFCIGKNVVANTSTYQKVLAAGHNVGNHTHNHLNGWKTSDEQYLQNINEAKKYINSAIFRPPYGKATKQQLRVLSAKPDGLIPVMWSVLSGDFDLTISNEECLQNVLKNTTAGTIIVFHDSEKAFEKLQYVLPKVLQYFSERGYNFKRIEC